MNRETALYRRALVKNLYCCAGVRERLLRQFQATLNSFLQDVPAPTYAELCSAFGTPEEMARVLMESVTPDELLKYRRHRTFRRVAAYTLVALILAFSLHLFIMSQKPFEIHHTITIIDTTTDTETTYTLPAD